MNYRSGDTPAYFPSSVRCVTCNEFFVIRERYRQTWRFHRCPDCAAEICAREIRAGRLAPMVVRPAVELEDLREFLDDSGRSSGNEVPARSFARERFVPCR